jgi:hypothetical protein
VRSQAFAKSQVGEGALGSGQVLICTKSQECQRLRTMLIDESGRLD